MNKTIDLNNAYIGMYDINGEYRIGLFVKGDVVQVENRPFSVRYYHDVLSNTTTALRLNNEGKDRHFKYSEPPLSNWPVESANWQGISGEMLMGDIEMYNLPPYSAAIDRFHHLMQFTSVYPNLTGQVSAEKVIECLADYCSKFELKEEAKKQLLVGLKEIPQYLLSQGSQVPTFENARTNTIDVSQVSGDFNTIKDNMQLNTIDVSQVPEDFNTIKHR